MEGYSNKKEGVTTKRTFITCERTPITSEKQSIEGINIEGLAKRIRKINDLQMMQSTDNPIRVKGATYPSKSDLLSRCIVGRFIGHYETPTHNEVSRWICSTQKDANSVQMNDVDGFKFLLKFMMRKMVENIWLVGEWRWQWSTLELNWLKNQRQDEFWLIKSVSQNFRATISFTEPENHKGYKNCSGWLETEEETEPKNHLWWAWIDKLVVNDKLVAYGLKRFNSIDK